MYKFGQHLPKVPTESLKVWVKLPASFKLDRRDKPCRAVPPAGNSCNILLEMLLSLRSNTTSFDNDAAAVVRTQSAPGSVMELVLKFIDMACQTPHAPSHFLRIWPTVHSRGFWKGLQHSTMRLQMLTCCIAHLPCLTLTS